MIIGTTSTGPDSTNALKRIRRSSAPSCRRRRRRARGRRRRPPPPPRRPRRHCRPGHTGSPRSPFRAPHRCECPTDTSERVVVASSHPRTSVKMFGTKVRRASPGPLSYHDDKYETPSSGKAWWIETAAPAQRTPSATHGRAIAEPYVVPEARCVMRTLCFCFSGCALKQKHIRERADRSEHRPFGVGGATGRPAIGGWQRNCT